MEGSTDEGLLPTLDFTLPALVNSFLGRGQGYSCAATCVSVRVRAHVFVCVCTCKETAWGAAGFK